MVGNTRGLQCHMRGVLGGATVRAVCVTQVCMGCALVTLLLTTHSQ